MESPWIDVSIPEANLHDHVFQQLPKCGKKIALIDGVTEKEYSYIQ